MDTIFAVSSGAPPAAIAVLRISGPGAFETVRTLSGGLPEPRKAGVRLLRAGDGTVLDRALVLCFPGPASATGEDLSELHLHGGRAVVRAVERALASMSGLRAAEAGEFTRRALLNGRIDLSEAEGLGDLLAAETEAQRRAAIRSAEGAVRRQVSSWSERLLALSAAVEALLDHSDEEDVAAGAQSVAEIHAAIAALATEIEAIVERPAVERLRDGIRVVLAGPPNAGKSTLLNALVEREAAIVSPTAGTTRDRIEVPVVRRGTAFVLIDTAGLAETTADAVEQIGIDRAREAAAEADILLWLGDSPPPEHGCVLWVHPRVDQAGRGAIPQGCALGVSAATGAGLGQLWDRLGTLAAELLPPPDLLALNARQRALCAAAATALREAGETQDWLLLAEHLRTARMTFDRVTGRADVEAMLDSLFARFCIGK